MMLQINKRINKSSAPSILGLHLFWSSPLILSFSLYTIRSCIEINFGLLTIIRMECDNERTMIRQIYEPVPQKRNTRNHHQRVYNSHIERPKLVLSPWWLLINQTFGRNSHRQKKQELANFEQCLADIRRRKILFYYMPSFTHCCVVYSGWLPSPVVRSR